MLKRIINLLIKKQISDEMIIAGARAIGNTMRWPNHSERAKEIWLAMNNARNKQGIPQ